MLGSSFSILSTARSLASALVCAGILSGASAASALTAREVVDGDTLVLENGDRVRLIGLDTPEIKDTFGRNAKTAKFEGLKKTAVDLYAVEAKSAAEDWIKGQKLRIQKDPVNSERAHRDDYGRLLAYVCRESDNHCLAEDLIAGGYGLVYRRFSFDRKASFIKLEEKAKAEGRGLWKHPYGKPLRATSKPTPSAPSKKKSSASAKQTKSKSETSAKSKAASSKSQSASSAGNPPAAKTSI